MSIRALKARLRSRFPRLWRILIYAWWSVRITTPWTESAFFRGLRRLRREASPGAMPAEGRKKILFFATRQERDQLAMLTTLAWSLQRRGHEVLTLGCDQALTSSCNSGNYPALNPWSCRTCHLYARHTHALSDIHTEWLSEFLPQGAKERACELVDAVDPERYPALEYRGYAIGRIVRHSVGHFLRTDQITAEPSSVAKYRDWLISAVWLVDACELLVEKHGPDTIVLLNGLFAPESIMLEVAKRQNVRVVTWEGAYRPESNFFAHDRPTDMADPAMWPVFGEIPLTEEENAEFDAYLSEKESGGGYLIDYFPDINESAAAVCSEFGIDRSRKIAVLFPNITWDSTLFEKKGAFALMAEWIESSIEWFATRPEAQLVIRIHPAEVVLSGADRDSVVELIEKRFPQLPSNIVIIPPGSGASSYVLMSLADCGLVYGSTTGIELGVRGVPVIVAGDVYYRGLGLSLDPKTPEEYDAALDEVMSGRVHKNDPARVEAWRRYAYYAIFRAPVPLRQIRYERVGDLPTLRYQSLTELDEGQEPNLDVVCRGIVEGTPILAASAARVLAMDKAEPSY